VAASKRADSLVAATGCHVAAAARDDALKSATG
jgi:hypothetical protein